MAQKLFTLSVAAFAAAALFLIAAGVLWFVFKIPSVIGDLSGKTARKTIQKMRSGKQAEKSGKAGAAALFQRSRNTGGEEAKVTYDLRPETGIISENLAPAVEETALLDETEGTQSLRSDKTQPLPEEKDLRENVKITVLEEVMLVHTDKTIL